MELKLSSPCSQALLISRLDELIDPKHPLVRLAGLIDRRKIERPVAAALDPSTLTCWRKHMGKEGVETPFIAIVEAARRANVIKAASLGCVFIDTTVMPKAISHSSDSKPLERGRQHLMKVANEHGISLQRMPMNSCAEIEQ